MRICVGFVGGFGDMKTTLELLARNSDDPVVYLDQGTDSMMTSLEGAEQLINDLRNFVDDVRKAQELEQKKKVIEEPIMRDMAIYDGRKLVRYIAFKLGKDVSESHIVSMIDSYLYPDQERILGNVPVVSLFTMKHKLLVNNTIIQTIANEFGKNGDFLINFLDYPEIEI